MANIQMPKKVLHNLRRDNMVTPVGGFVRHRAIGLATPYAYAPAGGRMFGVTAEATVEGEGFSLDLEGMTILEVAAGTVLAQGDPVAVGAGGRGVAWAAGNTEIGRCMSNVEFHDGVQGISLQINEALET